MELKHTNIQVRTHWKLSLKLLKISLEQMCRWLSRSLSGISLQWQWGKGFSQPIHLYPLTQHICLIYREVSLRCPLLQYFLSAVNVLTFTLPSGLGRHQRYFTNGKLMYRVWFLQSPRGNPPQEWRSRLPLPFSDQVVKKGSKLQRKPVRSQ